MLTKLAIKVDVDTFRGYREGLPRLLALFEKRGVKASIFFSFGPDNSGKAIRRVFRKGFISKMLRTKAPSTYGLKTLMYGTILPAPLIVQSSPDIFKRAAGEGHDCGIHAWDHVYIQDSLKEMSRDMFLEQFGRAAEMFESLSGERARSYAAPGWQCSGAAFSALDSLNLLYASDTRGSGPYFPIWDDKEYNTLQIPTTLPTMDEIWGLEGVTDETLPGLWLELMTRKWNVLTVHTEMEGLSKLQVFDDFIKKAQAGGVVFLTLRDIAGHAKAVRCMVGERTVTGRAGTLAVQEGSF